MTGTPQNGPHARELGHIDATIKLMAKSVDKQADAIEAMRKEFQEDRLNIAKQFSELNRYTLFDAGKVAAGVLTVWTGIVESVRALIG